MNCKTAEIYLDALMDNELSVGENLEIIDHIDSCIDCRAKWELSEEIKSKLVHYVNSLKAPSSLRASIYRKYGVSKSPQHLKQALLAASIAFLIGLGLFTGSSYLKIPALNVLHETTKLQLATNDISMLRDKYKINLTKHNLIKFKNAGFKVEGGAQIVKPFNRNINLVALKNDKGQKVSICLLPGNYAMPGCHKMEINGMTFFCGKNKDCHFAYWKQGGRTIALVGNDIESKDMIQLAMPIIKGV